MGTEPRAPLRLYIVDQIVVSVGPYMFHTEPYFPISDWANSGRIASPPQNTFKSHLSLLSISNNIRQVIGVACMTVGFSLFNLSWSLAGSVVSSRLVRMTRPPVINGKYISKPAISN